jgi:hypothetical protein
MKKLLLLTLAIFTMACSNDDELNEDLPNGVIKYERQIVNGERTSNTRQSEPNTACGEITESGVIELLGVNANYYWVVVCE